MTVASHHSSVAVRFRLEGARDAPGTLNDGVEVYPRAFEQGDLFHRVNAEGTEDYVVFTSRPEEEELVYSVDVTRVAGLRLVNRNLEFLDEGGAPRLRVIPPYVIDAAGAKHDAALTVDGCAFDASPAPPWARPTTNPGADKCTMHVSWPARLTYPLLVDPVWSAAGSMAQARAGHTATTLPSGYVLFAGGNNAFSTLGTAELYDPATGTFAATGSLSVERGHHTATLLSSGKVLFVGGSFSQGGCCELPSAELYDPATGTFAPTGSLSGIRTSHSATLLGSGKVLVVGGYGNAYLKSADLYDPLTGTFAPTTGTLNNARGAHTATVLPSGAVLVAGGVSLSMQGELYDPATETFALLGSQVRARYLHTATLLPSGKVLIAGGYNPDGPDYHPRDAELYDPVARTFAATGTMSESYEGHTASLLASGKVLIAGGKYGSFASREVLYDPMLGTFAPTVSMSLPRQSGHTATVLASGKVLIAGGVAYNAIVEASELFDLFKAGAGCAENIECSSGLCDNGTCCASPCEGVCMKCAADTGACVAVVSADDDTCKGTSSCDPLGLCKAQNGAACTDNGTCASGFCVDGVCCNTECASACDTCNTQSNAGRCVLLRSGEPGVPACAPYTCDGAHAECPTTCTKDADCTRGKACNSFTGACEPPGTCDGDHTITSANGIARNCSPYRCDSDATCRTACGSDKDCVAPAVCGAARACGPASASAVLEPPPVVGDPSGCTASRSPRSSGSEALVIFTLSAFLLLRRRRKLVLAAVAAAAAPVMSCASSPLVEKSHAMVTVEKTTAATSQAPRSTEEGTAASARQAWSVDPASARTSFAARAPAAARARPVRRARANA